MLIAYACKNDGEVPILCLGHDNPDGRAAGPFVGSNVREHHWREIHPGCNGNCNPMDTRDLLHAEQKKVH